MKDKLSWLFKGKDGKWIVGQRPNLLISLWMLLLVLNIFAHNKNVEMLQSAVLFAWAYMELVQGESRFRTMLGGIVLIVVIFGIFR